MKLIVIFGPQAVGKMTVGHELEKITNLKLFHNHMPIELISPFFDYSTKQGRSLVKLIRKEIFKAFVNSNQEGLIFTYVWYFDDLKDKIYLEKLVDIFRVKGSDIYYVELEAEESERIIRNQTEHRLMHKPTKRNLNWSEEHLKNSTKLHRINSFIGEIKEKNYLRINNTYLEADEVASLIKKNFRL
jgi:hypothetical protein